MYRVPTLYFIIHFTVHKIELVQDKKYFDSHV